METDFNPEASYLELEATLESKTRWQNHCLQQIPKLKNRYEEIMGIPLNINNPKTITEKIQWLKIYDSTLLKTICSDKITVRNYVKSILKDDFFVPILDIWNSFKDIDFSKLPKYFVLKTNHGSHTNLIVRDRNIDIDSAKKKFSDWMAKNWSFYGYELAYERIKKKIFAEQYMENYDGELTDYKFLCFNGKPMYCQIISDRFKKTRRLNYYDLDFVPMKEFSRNDFPSNYSIIDNKPHCWTKMIETSKKLSNPFKFVRIDFYEINNKPYISELTFFPGSGFVKYKNPETDRHFGDLLQL